MCTVCVDGKGIVGAGSAAECETCILDTCSLCGPSKDICEKCEMQDHNPVNAGKLCVAKVIVECKVHKGEQCKECSADFKLSEDKKECKKEDEGFPIEATIGIVVSVVAVLGIAGGLTAYFLCKKKKADGFIKGDAVSKGIWETANI